MSCVNSPRPEASNTHPLPHTATNGRVVSAVKAAKRKLCKTTKSGEDQYLSLLNIRNPLSQQVDSSVAQRLVWRRTRTLLPTTMPLQERHTSLNTHDMEQLLLNQKRQACNCTTHDPPKLKVEDTVQMKPFVLGQHPWKKAKVTHRLDESPGRWHNLQAQQTAPGEKPLISSHS